MYHKSFKSVDFLTVVCQKYMADVFGTHCKPVYMHVGIVGISVWVFRAFIRPILTAIWLTVCGILLFTFPSTFY